MTPPGAITPVAARASSGPSPWLQRWAHLLPAGGSVLDVACGRGRHLRWLAPQGWRLTAIDRDAAALASLADLGATVTLIEADIEGGPWPCAGLEFDAVLVTNYLWRPLWPQLMAALAPGGLLIYETFTAGNETVGKPSRPDFLLQAGELLTRCAALHVIAYEEGYLAAPARFVQRVVAQRPGASTDAVPPRHDLIAPSRAA